MPSSDAVNFTLPADLMRNRLSRCWKFPFAINITPKYTLVDLHVDQGMDVVSAGIGAAKIWFLYPPTVSYSSLS
jgi:hypothetical protein